MDEGKEGGKERKKRTRVKESKLTKSKDGAKRKRISEG